MGAGIVSLGLSGYNIGGTSDKVTDTVKEASPTPANLTPTVTMDSKTLFVAEGSDPDTLIKNGMKAIGGIEQFVKKGSTVVIKANFSVMRKPEEAATTNPQLVAAVVKECLSAGAKEVKVIDFPFTSSIALTLSGIKDAVEKAGGKAFVIDMKKFYEEVDTGGAVLKKVLYSKDVLEADVFINMPILKHHFITNITTGIKNLMGLVYDRGYFHDTDLNQTIAELAAYKKPHITIMDAIKGITTNGPTGPGKIAEWDQVIFGVDPVAVDAYASTVFGLKPTDVDHLTAAAKLGVGEIDLSKITIQKV
jgi:uncharacterized protein (DUF362 family)